MRQARAMGDEWAWQELNSVESYILSFQQKNPGNKRLTQSKHFFPKNTHFIQCFLRATPAQLETIEENGDPSCPLDTA